MRFRHNERAGERSEDDDIRDRKVGLGIPSGCSEEQVDAGD